MRSTIGWRWIVGILGIVRYEQLLHYSCVFRQTFIDFDFDFDLIWFDLNAVNIGGITFTRPLHTNKRIKFSVDCTHNENIWHIYVHLSLALHASKRANGFSSSTHSLCCIVEHLCRQCLSCSMVIVLTVWRLLIFSVSIFFSHFVIYLYASINLLYDILFVSCFESTANR